jgi:hypothetical protein
MLPSRQGPKAPENRAEISACSAYPQVNGAWATTFSPPDDKVVVMGGTSDEPLIPEARVDDLDLDDDTDAATWDARMDALAERRIRQARERLEQMGVIDPEGRLVSHELPPDMRPTSLTSVETG